MRRIRAERFASVALRFLTGDKPFGGTSVVHEVLPAGSSVPNLLHRRTDELIVMLKGVLRADIAGRRYRLKAGDVVRLPAGTPHRFSTGRASAEALSIFSPCMTLKNMDVELVEDAGP